MVKRQCLKCYAWFDKKSTYDYHINRKTDCSQNSNINDMNNDKSQKLTEINTNSQKLTENQNNMDIFIKNPNYSNILKSDCEVSTNLNIHSNINDDELICSYCDKKLVNKYSLSRHLKDNCKVKKECDEQKENIFKLLLEKDKQKDIEINELKKQNKIEINELKKQNKMLMEKIDKLINMKDNSKPSKIVNDNLSITNNLSNSNNVQNNNVQNNNIQNNNYVMVNFGKEDLSIIDERLFIDRIVKQNKITGVKIPDEVLKIIHFNPKYPQLSNIYISDINREKCMVYEDGEWKLSNIDNIPQIMDKICLFSKDQIEILREKYPNNKALNDRLNTIEKYNNKIDEDYIQDLREDDDYNGNKILIKDAEDFQKYAYNTIKKTLYNEGKKLKKTIKK